MLLRYTASGKSDRSTPVYYFLFSKQPVAGRPGNLVYQRYCPIRIRQHGILGCNEDETQLTAVADSQACKP